MTEQQISTSNEVVIGTFLEELEGTDNPSAVVRKYRTAYPELAALFRDLAGQEPALDAIRPAADTDYPTDLPDFRIEYVIGRGGMGVVLKAWQESVGRYVALKVHRGKLTDDELERFRREPRLLAQLHHPNIVPIHAVGQHESWHYFAMDYVEGAPLSHIIARTGGHAARRAPTPTLTETARKQLDDPESQSDVETGLATPAEPIIARPKPAPVGKPALSDRYFTSVAELMATVAEAVDYAHSLGVIHRDLKPGNILVNADGNPLLIDYGLARQQAFLSDDPDTVPEGPLPDDVGLTHGPMGTPQYMSPEQWRPDDTEPGPHIDIWALGVILYELVSLRRAFAGETILDIGLKVVHEEPAPLRDLVKNVPVDLVRICETAMRKDPADRYPTARAFADDLRRWLRREPTEARGYVKFRRPLLWVTRNKWLTFAMTLTVMALVAVGFLQTHAAKQDKKLIAADARKKQADAENRAQQDKLRADAADEQAREKDRTVKIQSLERLRLVEKELGWSEKAWGMMKELTKLGSDEKLRDQAASLLVGLDATRVIDPFKFQASGLAWNSQGHLLMGGNSQQPTQVWEGANITRPTKLLGSGPVTYTKDGRALQLVALLPANEFRALQPAEANPTVLRVYDVEKNKAICTLTLPGEGQLPFRAMVLAEDGSRVAAMVGRPDEKATIAVWDVPSGDLIKEWDRETTKIALTPDGAFLAAGSEDGLVSVFALPDGKEVATLPRHSKVSALAFGRNVVRPRDGAGSLGNWLLAVGDLGAGVAVWNPELKIPVSYCNGSAHHIFALAFSPDGVTLASAGRTFVNLWDIATGKPVLRLPVSEYHRALAFSPDGERLAVSSATGGVEPEVHVFKLQNGRGLTSLRGLVGEIAKVTFSPDGTKVAAASHRFDTAVWEWPSGRLLHVFDTPKGMWADNLAVALSHDGKRLAYSSHNRAVLYDLTTGKELNSWPLPIGFVELMAFDKTDKKLMLFRAETDDPKVPPWGSDPRDFPRVCRLRNLLEGDQPKVVAEFKDFDWHVFEAAIATDASLIVAGGIGTTNGKSQRVVKVIDGTTGEELWKRTIERKHQGQSFVLDLSGTFLLLSLDDSEERQLMGIRTQKPIAVFRGDAGGSLSPGADYWGNRKDNGFGFGRRADKAPLLLLGLDLPVTTPFSKFHPDPKKLQVVWGVRDGTVIVADIPQVKEKLKELKLDW